MIVTGAAGFIGSHLTERLLADGHRVIGIESFSDHYPRWVKEQNMARFVAAPQFELIEVDVARHIIADLFVDVDVAFHLAARPGVRASWGDFNRYVESNVIGSRVVFDAAAASNTRVVYASSSSVYGDASLLPVTEATPLAPISPYGASKVMTEALAGAYCSAHGLDVVGLRYFSVYGPRQRPDMGISRFFAAAMRKLPIAIYGDGLQRRDVTYVGDVVEATVAAAERGHPKAIYNIGSGAPQTLLEILKELERVIESPLKLAHESPKAGDVRDTWADISMASEHLNYRPSISLREGLELQAAECARRHPPDAATGRAKSLSR